jgi:hypothetical protein
VHVRKLPARAPGDLGGACREVAGRWGLCGGCRATGIPTATRFLHEAFVRLYHRGCVAHCPAVNRRGVSY